MDAFLFFSHIHIPVVSAAREKTIFSALKFFDTSIKSHLTSRAGLCPDLPLSACLRRPCPQTASGTAALRGGVPDRGLLGPPVLSQKRCATLVPLFSMQMLASASQRPQKRPQGF